jgi:hypothetical protein
MQYMQQFFGEHTPSPRKQCFIEAYEQLDRDLNCHTGVIIRHTIKFMFTAGVIHRHHIMFTLPGPYNHIMPFSEHLTSILLVNHYTDFVQVHSTCVFVLHIVC